LPARALAIAAHNFAGVAGKSRAELPSTGAGGGAATLFARFAHIHPVH